MKKSKLMNGTRPAPQPAPPPLQMNSEHIRVTNYHGHLSVRDANGLDIPGIIACDVAMRPGAPPLMRINLAAGNFDVEGLPVFGMVDPVSRRFRPIKRVEFADGGDDFVAPVGQPAPPVSSAAPAHAETPATSENAPEATQ